MPKAKEAPVEEPTTGTNVISVKDRIKNRLANIDKTTDTPATKNISLKGNKFTLPNGASSPGPLNCIILDYVNFNAWYEGVYDPQNPTPPDCAATHREIDLMRPNPDLIKNPVNSDCPTCDYNQFGSNGRGKICKNQVMLAIIPEDFDKNSEVSTIKVAPKGLKRWASHVRTLEAQGLDPMEVVTSISFVDGVDYPSLAFKPLSPVADVEKLSPFLAEVDMILGV